MVTLVELEVWGKATVGYAGEGFEWVSNLSGAGSTKTMVKNCFAGSQLVAVRHGAGTGARGLVMVLPDHLGSSILTADPVINGATNSPNLLTEVRYYAWGSARYTSGTTATDRKYTGQQKESGIGLYFYKSRWYDSQLGRFISPDTIVPGPGNVLSWDRFSYVLNNPVRYTDPSGHDVGCAGEDASICGASGVRRLGVTVPKNKFTQKDQSLILKTIEKYANFLGGDRSFRNNLALSEITSARRESSSRYNAYYTSGNETVNLENGWYSDSIFEVDQEDRFVIQVDPVDIEKELNLPPGSLPNDEVQAQFVLAHEITHSMAFNKPIMVNSFSLNVNLADNSNPIIFRNQERDGFDEEVMADAIASYLYSPQLLAERMIFWIENTLPDFLH